MREWARGKIGVTSYKKHNTDTQYKTIFIFFRKYNLPRSFSFLLSHYPNVQREWVATRWTHKVFSRTPNSNLIVYVLFCVNSSVVKSVLISIREPTTDTNDVQIPTSTLTWNDTFFYSFSYSKAINAFRVGIILEFETVK
jgi:hypothetical protein